MTEESITFKKGTASVDEVFAHLNKCNNNFVPPLNNKVDIGLYSKKIVENSITFEAWIKDELVGLIAAYFNDTTKTTGYITSVSTVSEYAGRGIASQLLKMCIGYGIQNQFKIILLEVSQHNNNAIYLYKKYDFCEIGRKEENIIMKNFLVN